MKGTPAYSIALAYVDGGQIILREGPNVLGVVLKGAISAPSMTLLTAGGRIFNTPYDNQIILTP